MFRKSITKSLKNRYIYKSFSSKEEKTGMGCFHAHKNICFCFLFLFFCFGNAVYPSLGFSYKLTVDYK